MNSRPVRHNRTVSATRVARHRGETPAPAQVRAADHLSYIRETLERAGSFTAVSGWGQVGAGVVGLVAAPIAAAQATPAGWATVWVTAAVVAAIGSGLAIRAKALRLGLPLASGPARRFALTFVPPLVAGAGLTVALWWNGQYELLAGTWLLLFGTGVATGGALSVPCVPLMGASFMTLGAVALIAPEWATLLMAIGFGGVMMGFGLYIAARHGG